MADNFYVDLPVEGGGGGSGTVTSVSVVTANGVSGSVSNPTTTPAITLTLGYITPSSVVSPGVGAFSSLGLAGVTSPTGMIQASPLGFTTSGTVAPTSILLGIPSTTAALGYGSILLGGNDGAGATTGQEAGNKSTGTNSLSGGWYGSNASGEAAFAFGEGCLAGGNNSFSVCNGGNASGPNSFTANTDGTSQGDSSSTFGVICVASGAGSFAAGYNSTASNTYAFSMGNTIMVGQSSSFGVGKFNSDIGSLFCVGNGVSGTPSNAFTIAPDSTTVIGTPSTTPTHGLNTSTATPASGVGTITNLPTGSSGNPTGYITITINGTIRNIPFW